MTEQRPAPIALTDEMRERSDSALLNRTPCMMATASASGEPSIAFKGSMMVFDDEHLAYWERTLRGQAFHVEENPQVVVYYADLPNRVHWKFFGEAIVHRNGEIRERIMSRVIPVELDRDPERKGYGVLVRVGKILDVRGDVLQLRT